MKKIFAFLAAVALSCAITVQAEVTAQVTITVKSQSGLTDELRLIEMSGTSAGYDNGWDVSKIVQTDTIAIFLYAYADGTPCSMYVTDDLNETGIIFQSYVGDADYTFTFSNVSGKQLYLYDAEQESEEPIMENERYSFSCDPGYTLGGRFTIRSEQNDPTGGDDPTTGGDDMMTAYFINSQGWDVRAYIYDWKDENWETVTDDVTTTKAEELINGFEVYMYQFSAGLEKPHFLFMNSTINDAAARTEYQPYSADRPYFCLDGTVDSSGYANGVWYESPEAYLAAVNDTINPSESETEHVQIGDLYYNLDVVNRTAAVTFQEEYSQSNYSGLATIVIPSTIEYNVVAYSVTSIGERAFTHCSDLTSVFIPNSIITIGRGAFSDSYNLTNLTIPNSVISIEEYAFEYCLSLTSITSEAITPPTCGTDVFSNVNTSIPLYVPTESVEAYQKADGWNWFTNIKAIGNDSTGGDTTSGDGIWAQSYCEAQFTWYSYDNQAFSIGLFDAEEQTLIAGIAATTSECDKFAYDDGISFSEDDDYENHYYCSTKWILNADEASMQRGDSWSKCVRNIGTEASPVYGLNAGKYEVRVYALDLSGGSNGEQLAEITFGLFEKKISNLTAQVSDNLETVTLTWDSLELDQDERLYAHVWADETVAYDNFDTYDTPESPLTLAVVEGKTYTATVQVLDKQNTPLGPQVTCEFIVGVNPTDTTGQEPSDAPTVEALTKYANVSDSTVVLAMYFDETPCYDVVLTGAFCGWGTTDEDGIRHFQPMSGYEGWYYVEIPWALNEDGSAPGIKPVQLQYDGTFSWDYQAGDAEAWIHRGGEEAYISGGYVGECDINLPVGGAYIYELAYWKNHKSACADYKKVQYTISFLPPVCSAHPEYVPAIAGNFNNWEFAEMSHMVAEDGDSWQITVEALETSDFKLLEYGNGWSNSFEYFDQEYNEWINIPNDIFPESDGEQMILRIDYSDTTMYRYALCGAEEPTDTITPTPTDSTMAYYLIGSGAGLGSWNLDSVIPMDDGSLTLWLPASAYEFKVLTGELSWESALDYNQLDTTCSSEGLEAGTNDNVKFVLAEEGEVTVRVVDQRLCVTGTFGGEVAITGYSVVGDGALVGVDWDPESTLTDMTLQDDSTWIYTVDSTQLEAGKEYLYKVIANHTWSVEQYPNDSTFYSIVVAEDGVYSITYRLFPGEDVQTTIEFLHAIADTITPEPCDTAIIQVSDSITRGESFTYNGRELTEAGDYQFFVEQEGECPMIVILTLIVKEPEVVISVFGKDVVIIDPTDSTATMEEVDVFGDSTMIYNPEENTLTFSSLQLEVGDSVSTAISYTGTETLTIVLCDSSTIFADTVISSLGDVVVTGEGVLVAEAVVPIIGVPTASILFDSVTMHVRSLKSPAAVRRRIRGIKVIDEDGGPALSGFSSVDYNKTAITPPDANYGEIEIPADEAAGAPARVVNALYVERGGERTAVTEFDLKAIADNKPDDISTLHSDQPLDPTKPMYNILGIQVDAAYKGVVIQGGRKYVR